MHILREVVYPLIQLPRDMNRYLAAIQFAASAVGQETNLGDLAGIEALRLFRQDLYQAIRKNRDLLCGAPISNSVKMEKDAYDLAFMSVITSSEDRKVVEHVLMRLFPRSEAVWRSNYRYDDHVWRSQRRICDPGHFSTYFRLSLSHDVLPAAILNELRSLLDNEHKVENFFRRRAVSSRASGQSEVSLVMSEILGWGNLLNTNQTKTLLNAISKIADTLMIGEKSDIDLQFHWLLNALVRDRFPQDVRSHIILSCFSVASFRWAISLATRVYKDHFPGEGDPIIENDRRLVDSSTEAVISKTALQRIRESAITGVLQIEEGILPILYSWRDLSSAAEVRAWTDTLIAQPSFLLSLAGSLTGTRTTISGNQAAETRPVVHLNRHGDIINISEFEKNIRTINPVYFDEDNQAILANFFAGLELSLIHI